MPGPLASSAHHKRGRQIPGRHDRREQERSGLHLRNLFKRSRSAGPFHLTAIPLPLSQFAPEPKISTRIDPMTWIQLPRSHASRTRRTNKAVQAYHHFCAAQPRVSWLPRRDPGRVWSFEEQAVDTLALALESGEHAAVEFPRAGELDPHRIDEMAIDDDFVMEMRPGREAGLTEITDDLALPDMGAFDRPAGKPGHVIIGRDVPVGVLNLDPAAIT